MSLTCQECQDSLLARAQDASAPRVDAIAHVQSCAACARFAARAELHRRAFGDLTSRGAPVELDGRVVGACHAGYRQERVVGLVASLARWNVPSELDRKVLAPDKREVDDRSIAPDVLDRLVAEDLRDPSKAIVRRFAGRLRRLSAPPELRTRVERSLAAARHERPRTRVRLVQAALVSLIAGVGAAVFWLQSEPERDYRFEVRRGVVHAGLDPVVRGMLDGLSGGLLEATERARDER